MGSVCARGLGGVSLHLVGSSPGYGGGAGPPASTPPHPMAPRLLKVAEQQPDRGRGGALPQGHCDRGGRAPVDMCHQHCGSQGWLAFTKAHRACHHWEKQ